MASNRISTPTFVRPTVAKKLFVYPDILRFRGSVIPSVAVPVISMTAFTFLIVYLKIRWGIYLGLPNSLVPSLSVVVGLLLVFRTNTAYDRYYEGRRLWTTIKSSIRNLVRAIYIIPSNSDEAINEKVDNMKLAAAFAIATKHYLRDELEFRHSELDPLLPACLQSDQFCPIEVSENGLDNSLPTLSKASNYLPELSTEVAPLKKSNTQVYQSGYGSVSSLNSSTLDITDSGTIQVNLPVDIVYYLNEYIYKQRSLNNLEPPTYNAINGYMNSLIDSLAGLERIMRTPVPLAYIIHLKQAVTLYLLVLPFTLLDLNLLAIPLVAIISFTLYGIDAIGEEIENPFGYDANDLPLDSITQEICDEINAAISKLDS